MTTPDDLLLRFAAALAAGLVVGVERGWRERDEPAGSRTAGVRTYALSALLGAILAAAGQQLGSALPPAAGLLAFGGAFTWFKLREATRTGSASVTGVVAGLAVYGVGVLTVVGDPLAAAAAAVAVAGLLASRDVLHGLLTRLSWSELRSALLLLAMTVIVLPLLPDHAVDPYGGVVPSEIWAFTVLTAGISYGGYVAVRVAGPMRGLVVASLAGAVVSSTAVTVALARQVAAGAAAQPRAGGAALAALVSILRVLTIVALVAPPLIWRVAPPALAAAAVFAAAAAAFLLRDRAPRGAEGTEPQGNPFEIRFLLIFAAAFSAVAFLAAWLTQEFGSGGLLVNAAVVGVVDVDIATLTAARLSGGPVSADEAADAILLVLAVNALARVIYAATIGAAGFALRLAGATAAALAAGLATAALLGAG